MKKNDGGPAFPKVMERFNNEFIPSNPGISLRDYFAAGAMTGLVASPDTFGWEYMDIARRAYCQADAMLEERGKE